MILYDAARCPYCARARIVLAEKGLGYETVEIDLSDRPAWIYAKNPSGTVPVLEEDGGFVLPESLVIIEYLNERPLTGKFKGQPNDFLVTINHTVLNLACPEHRQSVILSKRYAKR